EIARALALSRTSVENAIPPLAAAGLVVESTHSVTGRRAGRPARRYDFRAAAGLVVGVDVGSASVRVLVADLTGKVLSQHRFEESLPQADGAARLAAVLAGIRQSVPDEQHE